jgi:cytoskeletal protein CcmA (bactofilin family)
MNQEYRQDLTMNGSGSSSGGMFQKVKINGDATISNDLDCIELRVNGTNRIMGNVIAKHIKVNGMSVIEGSVDSETLNINGQIDIGGDLSVRQLKIHGKSDIGGNLTGDRLEVGGEITVQMDCEAETFNAKGAFTIGGLLNAGNIEIHLYGPCKVREIGGETIQIKSTGFGFSIQKIIQSLFPNFEKRLTVDTIEGDDIYLENTTAKYVRGNRVTIGPGCEITSIEYKDHFEQDKGAKIGEHNQL